MASTGKGGRQLLLAFSAGAQAVVFEDTGDLVTLVNHGLRAGTPLKFTVITTTTGITVGTQYFALPVDDDNFQVALTPGGSAVTLTTDGTGTMGEAYVPAAGLREVSATINGEVVDITNHDSDEWMEKLDEAGIRSASFSGSGVFSDDNIYAKVRAAMLANQMKYWRVYKYYKENQVSGFWEGKFKSTSIEEGGAYNNEQTYSVSLESSGPVSWTAFVA